MEKKKKSIRIKKGDVFYFGIGENKFAYGQVVIPGNVIYVVVYKKMHCQIASVFDPQILSETILCGWTLDGRIYHGMWKIVGNAPLPDNVPFPCYKVGVNGVIWVKSFDGQPIRLASDHDCQILDYRTTISPITFEEAFAAIHGLHEWELSFDKLRVEYAREREKAC